MGNGSCLPDVSDISGWGGPLANYGPVVDPTTDEDVRFRNFYVNDVARAGRVIQRLFFSFLAATGTNPSDPAGFIQDAVWGNSNPTYKPVITWVSTGLWLATLPTTVQQDGLFTIPADQGGGITHTVNIRRAQAQCQCADGTLRHARAEAVTANTVNIRGWTAAGALDDLNGQVVTVWCY